MKKLLFVPVIAFLLFNCTGKNEHNILRVGASVKNITPEIGAFIAGDANNRQFTGVHDSLYVKAIVVFDSKNSMALLSFDCIGMLYPTLLQIRKEVALKIPLTEFDPSHIVMASTHTHEGPDVVGIWGPDQLTSGVDTVYMKKLVKLSTDAIVSAWKSKQSASAQYAVTEFGKDWVYNISDTLNLDRELSIIQFLDKDGKSIATMSNFACHPTIMDGATSLVSADYLAGMYAHLNQTFGGVNFFLQGAIGGWVQPEYEAKTFDVADKRGRELGLAIETALKNPVKMDTVSIFYKSLEINLPISNPGFQQLAAAGVIKRNITDSVSTEIAWFSIGNAQFVTHPGETTPTHSLQSKKLMKMKDPKFVIGFGMDGLGYMLTPEFYAPDTKMKHVGYLSGMSIDPNAGSVLMSKIGRMASEK